MNMDIIPTHLAHLANCGDSIQMITQKTWVDLLGTDATDCLVMNSEIVKRIGEPFAKHVQYRILWHFNSNRHACEAFETWKNEIKSLKYLGE